ncbi:MAG: hypothetical protein JXA79_13220, partial [Deltaproteobacteria bacterium]|nr:hypothetical protein [Deltaproteobacteria bacterium]
MKQKKTGFTGQASRGMTSNLNSWIPRSSRGMTLRWTPRSPRETGYAFHGEGKSGTLRSCVPKTLGFCGQA